MVIACVKNLTPECTLSLAWISLSFLRANTWICDETCFRVLVLPVRNLMYRAISSFLPGKNKQRKILEIFLKMFRKKNSMRICTHMRVYEMVTFLCPRISLSRFQRYAMSPPYTLGYKYNFCPKTTSEKKWDFWEKMSHWKKTSSSKSL